MSESTLWLRAEVGTVQPDDRTVEVVFSTGADWPRRDWQSGQNFLERLSLDPKHVRLDRLNAGAPLLASHDGGTLAAVMGVVVEGSARVDGKIGRLRARFSKRPDVEPYYQDVRDKVLRNVSVGYIVHAWQKSEARGADLPVWLAVDWEPYEVSLVPIPVDKDAQIRRRPAASITDADRLRRLRLAEINMAELPISDADRVRRLRFAQLQFPQA